MTGETPEVRSDKRRTAAKAAAATATIPHICHFFYTGRIFEFQSFTPKNYAKHP